MGNYPAVLVDGVELPLMDPKSSFDLMKQVLQKTQRVIRGMGDNGDPWLMERNQETYDRIEKARDASFRQYLENDQIKFVAVNDFMRQYEENLKHFGGALPADIVEDFNQIKHMTAAWMKEYLKGMSGKDGAATVIQRRFKDKLYRPGGHGYQRAEDHFDFAANHPEDHRKLVNEVKELEKQTGNRSSYLMALTKRSLRPAKLKRAKRVVLRRPLQRRIR